MRKRSYGTLLGTGLAATVLAISLAATPSLATTAATWTVNPGGKFSATIRVPSINSSGRVLIKDKVTKADDIVCQYSSISGKLKSGSGLAGAHIASIAAWSFGTSPALQRCTDTTGQLVLVVTFGAFPYHLNAHSYASGETTADITGVRGTVSGSCDLSIAGTSATTPGQVKAVYTNSTHKLVVSSGTLHFYKLGSEPNNCKGLYNIGDRITISATYAIKPAQSITSP